MKPSETKKNITDIIRQYSLETGIPEAFVEKDVFVLKVLSVLSNIDYPDVKIAFSGGTCLSKAYGKIKRFSEDIDFCIQTSVPFSRKDKSRFRKFIISTLNQQNDFNIIESKINITDESSFFSLEIEYSKTFESSSSLRKNIKAEFKFENFESESTVCQVESMLHPYINDEVVSINCINVTEIMANKFSALLWRSYIKDRSQPLYTKENDPTIMRHLYDIATLEKELITPDFVRLVKNSFIKDISRASATDCRLIDFADEVFKKLISDKLFKNEYSLFVESMCYSKERISFESALKSLRNIIDYIKKSGILV